MLSLKGRNNKNRLQDLGIIYFSPLAFTVILWMAGRISERTFRGPKPKTSCGYDLPVCMTSCYLVTEGPH